MDSKGGKKKRSSSSSSSNNKCECVIPLAVADLRPWGVPKYQVPAFADVISFCLCQCPLLNSDIHVFLMLLNRWRDGDLLVTVVGCQSLNSTLLFWYLDSLYVSYSKSPCMHILWRGWTCSVGMKDEHCLVHWRACFSPLLSTDSSAILYVCVFALLMRLTDGVVFKHWASPFD